MTVVTRFAPSPTGSLHVGGARTALYCLLHAHHHGGRFLLRIEDTDRRRSTRAATAGILGDLAWLGLDWDEGPGKDLGRGPYVQSERLPIYQAHFELLVASGHAYEAWESTAELTALRDAAAAEKRDFRYRQRELSADQVAAFRAEGRVPVLRLRAPDHDIVVHDKILGDVTLTADQLEDIVIRKADGWPTYHFAVVVDDTLMGVTQVLRGSEHLMNTPKHLGLYEALGWEPVDHGHMPLIFNPGGSKMSKRDKAKTARAAARAERDARGEPGFDWLAALAGIDAAEMARFMKKKSDSIPVAEAIARALDVELPMIEIMDFRRAGYLPEALNNYLALLGWNPGPDPDTGEEREIFTLDELVARWDLGRVGKTPARFDPDKLRWMNGEYMRSLPDDRIALRLQQWFDVTESALDTLDESLLDAILALYRPRAHTFAELERAARYFWVAPASYDAKAVKKWILKGDGLATLAAARGVFETCEWTESGIEAAVVGLAESRGIGVGKVAQPVRIALSGAAATPGLWETLVLFERAEVLSRVDAAVAQLGG